jgi:predicted 3-demethylubiquinone-9 3-methyltransferase (glyoxalase superfamily)
MQKITPFLWFDDQAEQAAELYVSVFSNRPGADPSGSEVLGVSRYGEAGPGPAGTAMTVTFRIEGQELIALNGGPNFRFTEAISFVVDCTTQEEVDYLWEKLSEGGEQSQCGWLKDRFGLSWQIVPSALGELMSGPDPERSQRVMKAMLQMGKLDIAGLQRAYEEG